MGYNQLFLPLSESGPGILGPVQRVPMAGSRAGSFAPAPLLPPLLPPTRVALSLLGTGVVLRHLCQLHVVVKAQQLDPMLGSILDLCNLLAGIGIDDLTGRDAKTLDQRHLCLWGPKGGGEEVPGSAGSAEAKETQMRGK